MKQAILLHNPGAGDEDHVKSELVKAIEKEGFGCVYFSVKDDDSWKEQLDQADFVVVAGGDGTIRRVVKELVQRNALEKKIPIAILPMGTANNMSKTLCIDRDLEQHEHIQNWKKSRKQRFDLGVIKNADTTDFFMESAGYGLFPNLMQEMDAVDKSKAKTAKDELQLALQVLHSLVLEAKAHRYSLKADGKTFEGKCLLLEVMNIQSIGPNLILAPEASTADGVFDVVYVDESQRQDFADYLQKLIDGDEDATFAYNSFEAKELVIDCASTHMHLDDELILPLKNPLSLEVRENVLEFLTVQEQDCSK
ncbi:diacylglycerol/lipid kinase family protein [Sphingobacterium deserti]|uniref:Diacylglycerol kinase catalytic region n=1 Tax=Sphingobacterium deserti TaxID=1229276 RepID=A0A0B8T3A3_9SPHI|nr:diacylglycerol kinase family protein [Sphingobacterium deserti]KGE15992.1 diacylglycerol kinase catalytic region [Sphingobacterium deserti]